MTTRRKFTLAAGAATAGLIAAPQIARAQTVSWRMVTSWPKRLPGPGMSAERVAERVRTLSGGRIDISVYAAGEVVPAFEVLGAVGNGVADIGHTASFYWQGKMPAAAFFTTVPFGLTPAEHVAWIEAGGGQALWDELYAPFGVKPFMGGNTGVCMGGWFRRELKSLADLRGLEAALARPWRRSLSPARRHAADHAAGGNPDEPAIGRARRRRIRRPRHRHRARALSRGAVLLLSRLQQAERHRRMHRRAESRGTRCPTNSRRSSRTPARRRRITRWPRWSGSTRRRWKRWSRTTASSSRPFPTIWWRRARKQAADVLGGFAVRSDITGKVHGSYDAFRERSASWSRVSIEAVLRARGDTAFRDGAERGPESDASSECVLDSGRATGAPE